VSCHTATDSNRTCTPLVRLSWLDDTTTTLAMLSLLMPHYDRTLHWDWKHMHVGSASVGPLHVQHQGRLFFLFHATISATLRSTYPRRVLQVWPICLLRRRCLLVHLLAYSLTCALACLLSEPGYPTASERGALPPVWRSSLSLSLSGSFGGSWWISAQLVPDCGTQEPACRGKPREDCAGVRQKSRNGVPGDSSTLQLQHSRDPESSRHHVSIARRLQSPRDLTLLASPNMLKSHAQ